jgi:hypothetical protein
MPCRQGNDYSLVINALNFHHGQVPAISDKSVTNVKCLMESSITDIQTASAVRSKPVPGTRENQ